MPPSYFLLNFPRRRPCPHHTFCLTFPVGDHAPIILSGLASFVPEYMRQFRFHAVLSSMCAQTSHTSHLASPFYRVSYFPWSGSRQIFLAAGQPGTPLSPCDCLKQSLEIALSCPWQVSLTFNNIRNFITNS